MPQWLMKSILPQLFDEYKKVKKHTSKCKSFNFSEKKFKNLTYIPIFCSNAGFSFNEIGNINNNTESSYVNIFPIGKNHIIKYLKNKNNNKRKDEELKGFIFNLLLYKYLDNDENRHLLNYICRVLQIGYTYENKNIYCIMQKCGEDLNIFLDKNEKLLISLPHNNKIIFLLNLIKQCAIAIKIIHDLGYVHLDIKLENFLIVLNNINDINDYQIKIIDFGFIKEEGSNITSRRGSGIYINKIMIANLEKESKSKIRNFFDIYSLGIMFQYIIEIIFRIKYNNILNKLQKKNLSHPILFHDTNNNIEKIINIIDKMTTEEISKRYNSIDSVINDIDNLLKLVLS